VKEKNKPLMIGGGTTVRMRNRKRSLLCKLQDIEFLTFARTTQLFRSILVGSVALGGNGQFVRATALDSITLGRFEEYWKKDSLTEDLDLGIRLLTQRWESKFVSSTSVEQEGVEKWGHFFHQRTRWAWGNLQALRDHVLSRGVFKSAIPLRKKLDISIYFIFVAVPFLVLLSWLWFLLGTLGIVGTYNAFPAVFTIANSFSFFPLIIYGLWKERSEYPLWQIVPLLFVVTAYTYHWIPCLTSAILRMLTKSKPTWVKTPRSNEQTYWKPSDKDGNMLGFPSE
jgi:1,2-diacylglycerol 3-beta-glucosyltransferase